MRYLLQISRIIKPCRGTQFSVTLPALIFLMLTAVLPQTVLAQTVPSSRAASTPADTSKARTPQAIPTFDIANKVEAADAELHSIRIKLLPRPNIAPIENQLPGRIEEIDQLRKDPALAKPDQLPQRKLEDIRNNWVRHKTVFDDWQNTLQIRSQDLENEREGLLYKQVVWKKTLELAGQQGAPASLMQRVRAVIGEIDSVANELRQRLSDVLTVQSRISETVIVIDDTIDQIDAVLEQKRQRLFYVDVPPLWKALLAPGQKTVTIEQTIEVWRGYRDTFIKFVNVESERVILHLLIFLALTMIFVIFKKKSRRWEITNEELKSAIHILSYPVSTALLISLFFTDRIYPQAPLFIADLSGLLLLIPLLRILPGILYPNMRLPLYGLSVLYVMQKLYGFALQLTLFRRLLLLTITLIALAGLMLMVRPNAPIVRLRDNRWWRAMIMGIRISIVILAISVVSNIIGNITLAELLTSGFFISAFAGVVLFTMVLVLESFLALLLQTRRARSLKTVQNYPDIIKKRTLKIIHLTALIIWLAVTANAFDIFNSLVQWFSEVLGKSRTLGTLTLSLGDILVFIITVWVSLLLSRFIRFILQEDVMPRVKLPRGVSGSVSLLIHYTILFIGFLLALSAAGIEWSRFALLAGALGVGIGFGLQEIVNNFISGLILIFERPIKIGDNIEYAAVRGQVIRIGIRSSTVRTFDGAEVIIPNGHLISNELTNWTLSDHQRRVEVPVGVAYGSNPNQVLEILLKTARDHPEVLDNPEPVVLFTGFGDNSLNFALRFWTNNYLNWMIQSSQITLEIHNALYAAGIEIPFPQRDLHIRSIDPSLQNPLKKEEEKKEVKSKEK